MYISLESNTKYSIQAYGPQEVQIDSHIYRTSFIVCNQGIISDWPISHIKQLNEDYLKPLFQHKPEIILIGHNQLGELASPHIRQVMAKQHIGFECMSVGAACRTFNILLGKVRLVTLGIIL